MRSPARSPSEKNKSFSARKSNRGFNQRKAEGFSTTARAMISAGEPPSGARTLLGYTDSQSGRSLPLVGPPRGGTARSPSILKFSRLCPGKQPLEVVSIYGLMLMCGLPGYGCRVTDCRIEGTEQRATGSRAADGIPIKQNRRAALRSRGERGDVCCTRKQAGMI